MITKEDAVALLCQYIKNERSLYHCYAAEAVMRALARRLGQDEEKWGIAGLLHDLDLEMIVLYYLDNWESIARRLSKSARSLPGAAT